MLHSEDDQITD